MRVTDEVFIVGGGIANAFGLSADPDCHVYLIDGGDELALIDCGMAAGDSLERILGNVRAEGLDPARITKIIVTHYHMDHAGGAARFRERLGAEVIAPAGAADALRTGDERAVALDMAKAAGFYAQDYRFEPVDIAREVHEGEHIAVGMLELEVIETPGHCDGHVSYLLRGRERTYLFAGDAVFSGGRVVLQNIHDCSIQKSAESIAKLARIEFDALLPGHAAICLDGGARHVALAFHSCQSLFVPKNLV
ncbi:MAG: MBL fold metallo-hydrolase [Chloroflexia bacterium]|nr:MBL fold metallo-hydrolase [Chloroflexia bacterium]